MLRVMALLAVAVSIDVFMFDGRYSASVEHMAFAILRGFRVM